MAKTTIPPPRGLSDEWMSWDPETIAWYPEQREPDEIEVEERASRTGRWLALEALYFVLGGFLTGIVSAAVLAVVVLAL